MTEGPGEIVCTLFEGSYGIGVAALVNSLIASGYKGKLYVGFRGILPRWALEIQQSKRSVHDPAIQIPITFVPLEGDSQLVYYKPTFMLHILEVLEPNASGIIYFDADITVRCKWKFFQQWLGYGLMFCEDVNSPMHATHPRRMMWRRLFPDLLKDTSKMPDTYVNAGFVGLRRQELQFLRVWLSIIERAEPVTGGGTAWYSTKQLEPFSAFSAFDQDALNICVMASSAPFSVVGPEGMDFRSGGYIMSHAIGPSKPWTGSFFCRALGGRPPSLADRYFVQYLAAGPLKAVGELHLAVIRLDLLMAKMLGKFIR